MKNSDVQNVLDNPFDYKWSLQGFGMLRAYMDADHKTRLHIWDLEAAFPEVSRIHDHPWDFTSRIVSGIMTNQRYAVGTEFGPEFFGAKIKCGENACLLEEPFKVRVANEYPEKYGPEETYSMEAPEFHESFPLAGTVTIVERKFGPNRDVATVLWRKGVWGDAKPRAATKEEIEHFVRLAKGTAYIQDLSSVSR